MMGKDNELKVSKNKLVESFKGKAEEAKISHSEFLSKKQEKIDIKASIEELKKLDKELSILNYIKPKIQKSEYSPNQCLFVNNLNEKIKIEEIKINLYFLFSQHADVLDVHIKKGLKHKGQAFVLLASINQAVLCKKLLDDFEFFGKKLVSS